jgi:uncharacterized membrane protein YfcA
MMEILGYMALGLISGTASGLLGIGGAVIIIPALVYLFGYGQKMAQGTTLAMMVLPIGLMAALEYYHAGQVNLKAALIMALLFFAGGWLGGKLALVIDPGILKKVFAVFLILIAVKMIFEK